MTISCCRQAFLLFALFVAGVDGAVDIKAHEHDEDGDIGIDECGHSGCDKLQEGEVGGKTGRVAPYSHTIFRACLGSQGDQPG